MASPATLGPPAPVQDLRSGRIGPGDGLILAIRPLTAADAPALQAHVRALSARSRHNRYLGGLNELSRAEVNRLLGGVGGTVFPLVAEAVGEAGATMVGEAVFAIDPAGRSVEFALSVLDDWQGRGIGTALLRAIAERGAAAGARLLHGETLRGNEPMLALAAKLGAMVTNHRGDPRLVRIERGLVAQPAAVPGAEADECRRAASRQLWAA